MCDVETPTDNLFVFKLYWLMKFSDLNFKRSNSTMKFQYLCISFYFISIVSFGCIFKCTCVSKDTCSSNICACTQVNVAAVYRLTSWSFYSCDSCSIKWRSYRMPFASNLAHPKCIIFPQMIHAWCFSGGKKPGKIQHYSRCIV